MLSNMTSNSSNTSNVLSSMGFTLQRRLSTATDVKYDMYLLNLGTMMRLIGDKEDRKMNMNLCHQDLLGRDELIRFEDLPMGSFVMYVSHQWTGFNHPDPKGVHMNCMVNIFRQLRDGAYDVSMDPFHMLLFKHKHHTNRSEFKELMSNAYVWFDFWSQPQPTMAKSEDVAKVLRNDLSRALNSMGAYVERADCLVIVSPGTVRCELLYFFLFYLFFGFFLQQYQ